MMQLNSVYRGNIGFGTDKLCLNGCTSHREETSHGCVISLGHKMESDCVCVCAHMGVGGGREKERRKEKEAVTLPVWGLETDMHH